MTTREWQLSALEFSIVMQGLGRDRLPYPLRFRAPGSTGAEIRSLRLAAAEALAERIDERLYETLLLLVEPDVRIEVFGFAAPKLKTMIRMHAGVRRGTAVLAVQLPGQSADEGGDVVVRRGPARDVARDVVSRLPTAKAGERKGLAIHRDDLAEDLGNYMRPANEITAKAQMDEFYNRPRSGVGEIGVFAGSVVDSRSEHGRSLYWMDFAGDGRYLVRDSRTISAVPADGPTFANDLQRIVSVTTRANPRPVVP